MGDFIFVAPEGWTVIDPDIVQQAGGAAMFAALVDNRGFDYIKDALLPFGAVTEAQTVKDAKVFNNECVVLELVS